MAKTLTDLFINELQDAYNAETQLTKALPKLAKAAVSSDLRRGSNCTSRRPRTRSSAWSKSSSKSAPRRARTRARP